MKIFFFNVIFLAGIFEFLVVPAGFNLIKRYCNRKNLCFFTVFEDDDDEKKFCNHKKLFKQQEAIKPKISESFLNLLRKLRPRVSKVSDENT